MLDRPRLYVPVLLASLAGCLVEMSRHADPYGLQLLFQFLALVLFFAALVTVVDWLGWLIMVRFKQVREALAITEKVKVIQAVAQLSEAQIRLLESGTGVIEVMAGSPDPSYVLRIGADARIPFDFIEQFLSLDDGQYLCPTGTWSDGSKRREWAQLLTNHFILMGFAEVHNGNRAARWVDKEAALRWIGLDRRVK